MVDCLRNHQFGCRHYSKSSRTDKHLDLYTTDPHHKHVQFPGAVSDCHRSRRSHGRHSRSHAQSSLLSVGDRSGHNQQPEVRRCGVYTDVICSCRVCRTTVVTARTHVLKGRSRVLDPRRTSVIRASDRCLQ